MSEEDKEESTAVATLETDQPGFLDKIVGKAISRKFLAWLVGTCLLVVGSHITPEQWMSLTSVYIGGQALVDAVRALKS